MGASLPTKQARAPSKGIYGVIHINRQQRAVMLYTDTEQASLKTS